MVICCFFLKGGKLLPEDEVDSAQTSVFTHQITMHHIAEDSNFHTQYNCESFKFSDTHSGCCSRENFWVLTLLKITVAEHFKYICSLGLLVSVTDGS